MGRKGKKQVIEQKKQTIVKTTVQGPSTVTDLLVDQIKVFTPNLAVVTQQTAPNTA
jgi:hypothetical protein